MKKRSGFKVMMRLIGLVKPLAGYMILAILMGVVGHLCAAFITILGGYGVVKVTGISEVIALPMLFGMIGILALLRGFLRYGEQACNHFIAFKLLALIRDKVFGALRRLCPAKLDGKDKGDLISVITSDIELLEVFYAHTISPVVIALIFCAILSLFIGSYHPILGWIALAAYVTVGVVIPVLTSRFSGDDGIRFRTRLGELSAFVLDSLRGLQETMQYGQGQRRLDQMMEQTESLSKDEQRMKRTSGRNQAVTNSVILLFDLILLFVAAKLCLWGYVDFEGVLIPTVALMSSFGPCVALAGLGSTLQNTFAAGNRVLDILEENLVVEEIRGKEDVSFAGASVEQVTFGYGEENILEEVSLEIPWRAIIGIVGRSGSGKSTLLKLLMRFWEVQKGAIRIGDTNINHINTANLRKMQAYVTQETHLFHDSIRNNLRIAKWNATEEEMVVACKKASIHDFIMSLPQGYDTPVGELGDALSGGERQRLGLARAMLSKADMIALDEPTSNLDSLNEAVILRSLKEECENRTVVLVSHRQSTMRIADRVYSVECGRLS